RRPWRRPRRRPWRRLRRRPWRRLPCSALNAVRISLSLATAWVPSSVVAAESSANGFFPNDVGDTSPWVAAKSRIVAIGGDVMAKNRYGWRNDVAPRPEYSGERCLRRLGNAGRERSP